MPPVETDLASDVKLLTPDIEPEVKPEIKIKKVEPIKNDEEVPDDEVESDDDLDGISDDEEDDEVEEESDEKDAEEDKVKEEILPHERPTISQIKKEFPELFKKFPALRDVYFREKEYSELFPTVADARASAENSEVFDNFREDIFNGSGVRFVEALKDADALVPVANKFLGNLYKVDRSAHWEVVSPILENIARAFYQEGKNRKDENITISAENLATFLFGDSEFASGNKTNIKAQPKSNEVDEERATFQRERFQAFNSDINESVTKDITSTIKAQLDERAKSLSNTMKDLLAEKILKEVDSIIRSDKGHMTHINGLWKKANSSGFSSEYKSRITSAYLERAKALVPGIRRKLVAEVLGTTPEEGKRKKEIVEKVVSRREPGGAGRPSSGNIQVTSAKAVNWNKTSDMDFLNGNVTLKGAKK